MRFLLHNWSTHPEDFQIAENGKYGKYSGITDAVRGFKIGNLAARNKQFLFTV